jgi:hypothetical protein
LHPGRCLLLHDLPPTYLNVIEDPYGDCYLIVLPDAKAGFGHVIKMWNSAIEPVTISQRDGFWTKNVATERRNRFREDAWVRNLPLVVHPRAIGGPDQGAAESTSGTRQELVPSHLGR